MSILNARIDPRITRGMSFSIKVPGRVKSYDSSGRLYQNFLTSRPVHVYDLSHGLRSRDDFQMVVDAFYVCMFKGYEGCLVKDWRDYLASQSNSRCLVLTNPNFVQLQRKHSFGGDTYFRDITRPRAAPVPTVYRTHAGSTSSIGYSLDYSTGIATISGHTSGDTYTWAGEFDVPVAFSDDTWTGSLEVSTDNLFIQSQPIVMEEYLV